MSLTVEDLSPSITISNSTTTPIWKLIDLLMESLPNSLIVPKNPSNMSWERCHACTVDPGYFVNN
ncbi:3690_t:CDS:2 [Entrophospora sp. SA101]|nr:3690_t:CDS:2 [Entrophospora sp. SA101]